MKSGVVDGLCGVLHRYLALKRATMTQISGVDL